MQAEIQQLFPTPKANIERDTLYTFPELAFPTEGVPVGESGKRRPYVYFNMVSSMDGKIATAAGNAGGLGSQLDKHLMRRLRTASEGVMVGAATFRNDPFVPVIPPELTDERARYFPTEPQPWGIVLSRDGNLPLSKKFFQGASSDPSARPIARRLVGLGEAASPEVVTSLSQYARVVRVPNREDYIDLEWLLVYLYEEVGIRWLLCEGGPTLNYSLFSRGLGDELFLTFAPKLVAGKGGTILNGPTIFPLDQMPQFKLVSLYEQDSELFFRYRVEK